MKKLTNDECIKKLQRHYGDSLDYSKVNYTNSRSYITLICPIHGEFQQYANNALLGKGGCPKCKLMFSNKDEFISYAIKIHGTKYQYDKVNYINMSTPVIITCPIHGDFKQTPRRHVINKNGCLQCYRESQVKHIKFVKLSKQDRDVIRAEKWKKECEITHNYKYDYTLINNIQNLKYKVPIICPIHGIFYQTASSHSKGYGCNKCARLQATEKVKLSFKEFKDRATKIHGNKYIYNEYKTMHDKIKIICPNHGEFMITPSNHLKGYGCPTCSSSKGELFINQYLNQLGIPFTKQFSIRLDTQVKTTNLVIIDFKINYNNRIIFIEYNGIQHYKYIPYFHKNNIEYFNAQLKRDQLVKEYCLKNNIKLLEIPYTMSNENIEQTIKNILYENEEQNCLLESKTSSLG